MRTWPQEKQIRYGDRPLNEYTVDEALQLPAYAHPEWVANIQRLISTNPDHPRLGELRYYATVQWMVANRDYNNSTNDKAIQQEAIWRLDELTEQEGLESVAGYLSQIQISNIYENAFNDPYRAHQRLSELLSHPHIQGKDLILTDRPSNDLNILEQDLRRILFYEKYVATARGSLLRGQGDAKTLNEAIDQYSRRILQYPYWKGESLRTTFRKSLYQDFYNAHGKAATYFIETFSDDHQKLSSIHIVHHARIIQRRDMYIQQAMGILGAEEDVFGNIDHLVEAPLSSPKLKETTNTLEPDSAIVKADDTPTLTQVNKKTPSRASCIIKFHLLYPQDLK